MRLIELPDDYGVSLTFNVVDFFPYYDDDSKSWEARDLGRISF